MFSKILNISTHIIFYLSFIMIIIGLFVDFPIAARVCFLVSLISSFLGTQMF